MEKFLQDLTSPKMVSNPFPKLEKDLKKAIHPEDLFFIFGSFKEADYTETSEGISTVSVQRQDLRETSSITSTISTIKPNI